MAKTIADEEDRSGKVAAERIPDEMRKIASKEAVLLKPGREKPLLQKHPWIFSGAISSFPSSFKEGALFPVCSAEGRMLATAYFNKRCSLTGRVVAFGQTDPLSSIQENLTRAVAKRKQWFSGQKTDAFRLVHGEADGLPGLIVDQYRDLLVLQSSTLGMDQLKSVIVPILQELVRPSAIFEKSTAASRKEEGLPQNLGFLVGGPRPDWEFMENGIRFTLDVYRAQKTGFFLDQREMRAFVRELSRDKRVLNGFCYTGGFSLYAALGGAAFVHSVDISAEAIEQVNKHWHLNEMGAYPHQDTVADLFVYLREQACLPYDLVILDPPAFAKKKQDIVSACRGYKEINRQAMQKMPKGSLLLTCSCSYFVEDALFRKVLFQAALEAGRDVQIVGGHRLAFDHPIHLSHPEGSYLKSYLLHIE